MKPYHPTSQRSKENNSRIKVSAQERKYIIPREFIPKEHIILRLQSKKKNEIIHELQVPRILLQALITREDKSFFEHSGFSIRGTIRAAYNIIMNNFVSGGSTISQQVAGERYADRREFSINRKLKELWWSFQLERNWSKQEILEEYLNKMYFGHGNYGVETSSQFFFGHSTQDINSAEAVMLIIQLANPVYYSPFKNPNIARQRQKTILQQMVDLEFLSQEDMDRDIQIYWDSFDYTREGFSSAFLERDDKAPYFSEYVRQLLLEKYNFTELEINEGGLTIHTTLDLSFQRKAKKYFDDGLAKSNVVYRQNSTSSISKENSILPIVALSSLLFDGSHDFFHKSSLLEKQILDRFSDMQATLSLLHLMFEPSPNSLVANINKISIEQQKKQSTEETVEGAMITIDNSSGELLAMIGGSNFDVSNQFNRATQAFVQPGSSFKPLYYAAAIEEQLISPSTIIWDSPVVFVYDEEETYIPNNYKGEWKGTVTVREALSQSMNVPSLKILNRIGFKKALDTAGTLLGIAEKDRESLGLVEKYPVGLGIVSVSPIAIANAYSTIARGGKAITPTAIRYIVDKSGDRINIKKAEDSQFVKVLSPQTSYILTSLLQSTVQQGTLRYAEYSAGGFTQPTAGKTGTTQNWSDAWTIGFNPYHTTAVWFGFDRGGQSLGNNQTGAITTGPVWGKYMQEISKTLPKAEIKKPNGIVTLTINPENNTLATTSSPTTLQEVYIAGTEPSEKDNPSATVFISDYQDMHLERAQWNLSLTSTGLDEATFLEERRAALEQQSEEYMYSRPQFGITQLPSRASYGVDITLRTPSKSQMLQMNTLSGISSELNTKASELLSVHENNPFLQ
ncbi:penicillin-binding protein 1A-like [Ylistrum balloti]|uniref:penicillin-binding protein 1A-like n=1 Tax=Ylistrum balloti TaxID=509963 RepID=UPI002905AA44|nr:penicillin-binding protein 1A-like [Ylistrum balloti]